MLPSLNRVSSLRSRRAAACGSAEGVNMMVSTDKVRDCKSWLLNRRSSRVVLIAQVRSSDAEAHTPKADTERQPQR